MFSKFRQQTIFKLDEITNENTVNNNMMRLHVFTNILIVLILSETQ